MVSEHSAGSLEKHVFGCEGQFQPQSSICSSELEKKICCRICFFALYFKFFGYLSARGFGYIPAIQVKFPTVDFYGCIGCRFWNKSTIWLTNHSNFIGTYIACPNNPNHQFQNNFGHYGLLSSHFRFRQPILMSNCNGEFLFPVKSFTISIF